MAGFTVYNLPTSPPNLDRVGVFYILLCVIWSVLLIGGMLFCWFNRRIPIIRVRGIKLTFTAIALLHVYWILGQITYPIRPTMPTVVASDVQYFAMGIYFPFGIALFQASNLRFLYVAKAQRQFANADFYNARKCNKEKSSILGRWKSMKYMNKVLLLITTGMVFQLVVTIGMWLACAKYHPTYGISGTEVHGTTLAEQRTSMDQGWEWWPSVLWQVVWTWVAAPILFMRAWGVRDTMGWRTQTIACCVASLHATPMFLISSYFPVFAKINVYFAPSQWIHLSIFMWEIFTVFVPVFQVLRLRAMNRRTANSMAKYDPTSFSMIAKSIPSSPSFEWESSSSSTIAESPQSALYFKEPLGDRLYTMDALEHVLEKGSEPLLQFAALSDFSGENVAFLGEVRSWKCSWGANIDNIRVPNAFNQALGIYVTFISIQDAEFPLNISSQSLGHLQEVFEAPARLLFGDKNVNFTSPFVEDGKTPSLGKIGIQRCIVPTYTGHIPECFSLSIFDDVQYHIKWLVLTNTWPKFVDIMRRQSTDTDHNDHSSSLTTLGSQVLDDRLRSNS